jgi:AcrR family transcriptional regulator
MARPKRSALTAEELSERRERAHRILDAATALISRWGYNKTNVEDIAKQAGIGKGTIYLHWKTREALFRALVNRERLTMALDYGQRISADPAGATLYGLFKHYAAALEQRPLLKAFILGDVETLGKFSQSQIGTAAFAERMGGFKVYLDFLREHGLIRTDLTVREQIYTLGAIWLGFYMAPPLLPDDLRLTGDEIPDRLADSIQRTLGSGREVSAAEQQHLLETFLAYFDRALSAAKTQFQQELDAVP